MLSKKAHYIHDDPSIATGTICGWTYDERYYIIGFEDDYGCVLDFNPKKVYVDGEQRVQCRSFRFSAVGKTIFQ